MKATLSRCFLLLAISCNYLMLKAQPDFSKFEIGFNAGTLIYQGDLTPSRLGSYRTLKPELNVHVTRIIGPLFSLRTNFSFGKLKGEDSKYLSPGYRQQRNFNFTSPVFELSEFVVADFGGNNMVRNSSGLSPYLFAGLGFSFLNIKRDWSEFNAAYFSSEQATLAGLEADQQHPLPKMIPVLPIGLGVRYPLSPRISVSAEASYRFTFTDYLDGFSKSANDSKKDSYQTHSIGLIYRFAKSRALKCPVF